MDPHQCTRKHVIVIPITKMLLAPVSVRLSPYTEEVYLSLLQQKSLFNQEYAVRIWKFKLNPTSSYVRINQDPRVGPAQTTLVPVGKRVPGIYTTKRRRRPDTNCVSVETETKIRLNGTTWYVSKKRPQKKEKVTPTVLNRVKTKILIWWLVD